MAAIQTKNKTKRKDPLASYGLLFDNTLDGLSFCQMIFDKRGHPIDFVYKRVSNNFEELTGFTNVVGKKITELIPGIGDSNPEIIETYGRVATTGKPERFEAYVPGLARWFSVSVYCPQKNFFLASFQNITDRKKIDEDLKNAKIAARNVLEDLQVEMEKLDHAKAKDEALLESIGDGVVAIDQAGTIAFLNRAAESILGYKGRDLIGKLYVHSITMEDEKGNKVLDTQRPIALALTLGATTKTTSYFGRKDGVRIPIAMTVTPVILDGRPAGAMVVFRDVTKEKEIEKLRTDFLSLASHQLRTPLSGTKWLIDTMRRDVLGAMTQKQQQYVDHIYQMNERMIKLVSEMLNILVLESGGGFTKEEEVLVPKLCDDVVALLGSAAQTKKILLRILPQSDSALVIRSNTQGLRTILESIVSNAIVYSQEGQEVVLGVKEEPDHITFSVKDAGIGIPRDEQHRVFERFYRASNAKNARPEGTGLGLYSALLFTQKIGGKIFFESEEDKGTTFYLQVPRTVDAQGLITSGIVTSQNL